MNIQGFKIIFWAGLYSISYNKNIILLHIFYR